MALNKPKFLVTDELAWKEARTKYVTSTEMAAILGLNRYETANQIRQAKLHGSQEVLPETQAYFDAGHKWEDWILDYATKELKLEGKLLHTQGFYALEESRISATPDAVFTNGILIEAKATGAKNKTYWAESPPIKYIVQAQVQLMVTNADKCFLVGVFFQPWPEDLEGHKVAPIGVSIYQIDKNIQLQKKILDSVEKFWHNFNDETHKYMVPTFVKQENEQLAKSTASFITSKNFDYIKPSQNLTTSDLQIIRQVALECAVKLGRKDVEAIMLAKELMWAYADTLDSLTEVVEDANHKNVIIALQSALKRSTDGTYNPQTIRDELRNYVTYTLKG